MGPRSSHRRHTNSCTVPCTSTIRSGSDARHRVQAVDVLGDQRVETALAIEVGHREVTGVGARFEHLGLDRIRHAARRTSGSAT